MKSSDINYHIISFHAHPSRSYQLVRQGHSADALVTFEAWLSTNIMLNLWDDQNINSPSCLTYHTAIGSLECRRVMPFQWRHNERDGVSNHQPRDCSLNRLFSRRLKKTSKLCVTGLCVGNSPVTGEFPAQRASNAENVIIWWRHHALLNRTAIIHYIHRAYHCQQANFQTNGRKSTNHYWKMSYL